MHLTLERGGRGLRDLAKSKHLPQNCAIQYLLRFLLFGFLNDAGRMTGGVLC